MTSFASLARGGGGGANVSHERETATRMVSRKSETLAMAMLIRSAVDSSTSAFSFRPQRLLHRSTASS